MLNDDERAALRVSLGFSPRPSGDTFAEIARREPTRAWPEPPSAAMPPADARPGSAPKAAERPVVAPGSLVAIEGRLTELSAAVAGLAAQVSGLDAADLLHQLEELVRTQRAVVLRLITVEDKICRVTEAGAERVSARLEALEAAAAHGRRHRLDLLRR